VDQDGTAPLFSATREVVDGCVTVHVSGEVDMATADAMFQAASPDLTAVSFFDSAAIHALVRLAERYPGTLSVRPSPQVRRVLEISGLGDQPWLKG
jgi:stage II sporulation protein AA (anti-sigma F factor antagonist)